MLEAAQFWGETLLGAAQEVGIEASMCRDPKTMDREHRNIVESVLNMFEEYL